MRYLVRGGLMHSCALERACLGLVVDFDLRLAPQHLRNGGVWSPGSGPEIFPAAKLRGHARAMAWGSGA
jgi:hypothetical protein